METSGPFTFDTSGPILVLSWAWSVAIAFGSYRLWAENRRDATPLITRPRQGVGGIGVWVLFLLWVPASGLSMAALSVAVESLGILKKSALIFAGIAGLGLGTAAYYWLVRSYFRSGSSNRARGSIPSPPDQPVAASRRPPVSIPLGAGPEAPTPRQIEEPEDKEPAERESAAPRPLNERGIEVSLVSHQGEMLVFDVAWTQAPDYFSSLKERGRLVRGFFACRMIVRLADKHGNHVTTMYVPACFGPHRQRITMRSGSVPSSSVAVSCQLTHLKGPDGNLFSYGARVTAGTVESEYTLPRDEVVLIEPLTDIYGDPLP